MKVCGLSRIPNRRTFDRRLATISNDIKNRVTTMGELFVSDKIIDPSVLSTDSTLIKAKGHLWHKSSMKKKEVPRSGIDTDARWGFSHTKGWVFGYKLHMVASTGSIQYHSQQTLLPPTYLTIRCNSILTARSSLPVTIIKKTLYMSADPGYDDHELSISVQNWDLGWWCVLYKDIKVHLADRIKLIKFYKSKVGQAIYYLRSTYIEPLIGHIKSAFRIDPLPVRGHDRACAIVLLSVLLYQILVYYNCKTYRDNPMAIKYMLGT